MTMRPSIGAKLAAAIEKLAERAEEPPQTLGEIDALIERHGANAPAEPLIRFE